MAPVIPNPAAIHAFADASSFEGWLAANHDTAGEIFLRIFKKGSGVPTVTAAEALDVVLCWGWIDGIRKSFDEQSFLQRYTPRRPKSIWSQVNREHIERLLAAGLMQPSGLRQVEAANADGRWDAAYAAGRNMQVPDDLLAAIAADPAAGETFARLNRQNQFAMAFRLGNLKTEAGRKKRIADYVQMLAEGRTIYPQPAKAGQKQGDS